MGCRTNTHVQLLSGRMVAHFDPWKRQNVYLPSIATSTCVGQNHSPCVGEVKQPTTRPKTHDKQCACKSLTMAPTRSCSPQNRSAECNKHETSQQPTNPQQPHTATQQQTQYSTRYTHQNSQALPSCFVCLQLPHILKRRYSQLFGTTTDCQT